METLELYVRRLIREELRAISMEDNGPRLVIRTNDEGKDERVCPICDGLWGKCICPGDGGVVMDRCRACGEARRIRDQHGSIPVGGGMVELVMWAEKLAQHLEGWHCECSRIDREGKV